MVIMGVLGARAWRRELLVSGLEADNKKSATRAPWFAMQHAATGLVETSGGRW
jgi:hypothetical protein